MRPARYWLWALRFAFGTTVLWLVWRAAGNLRIGDVLAAFNGRIVLIGLGLSFVAWLLAAFKWSVLVPHATMSEVTRISFVSQFYGFFLPGQLGGEIFRAIMLARLGHRDRSIASVFVDRITSLAGIAFLAFLGTLLGDHPPGKAVVVMFGVIVGASALSLFVLRLPAVDRAVRAAAAWMQAAQRRPVAAAGGYLLRVHDALFAFARNGGVLSASLALGVAFQMLVVGTNLVLARHLGIEVSALDMAWFIGIVALALLLPLSIAGLGVREVTYVGILQSWGVPLDKGLTLSLAFLALGAVGASVGALLELLRVGAAARARLRS